MKITRSPKAERWLKDQVKAWLERQPRGPGIHVSDLLNPRRGYWKRVDPRPMTDADAGYFIAGQGHHFVIEAIIEGSKKTGKADAGGKQALGIWYSPDIRAPHPIEIKTTRGKDVPPNTERAYLAAYAGYLKQLKAYMALEDNTQGTLLVFYLNALGDEGTRTVPDFRWLDVVMTPKELKDTRAWLRSSRLALETAIRTKNHKILPECPKWMSFNCPWADKCGCGGPPKRRVRV